MAWSKYNQRFYKEFQKFLINTDSKGTITLEDFNNIFIQSKLWKDKKEIKRIEALQRLLGYKLKKINNAEISNNKKIDTFLYEIVWEQNLELIERYIEWLNELDPEKVKIKSLEDWHKFLVTAWDKLVKPIIAWGMWGIWLFNFLTKWWVDSVINQDHILEIPGVQNIVQAIITLSVLFAIKKVLQKNISKHQSS